MYLPYVVVVILLTNAGLSSVFIVLQFVKKAKFRKVDHQSMREDNIEIDMHRDLNKKVQEMIKTLKNNNINGKLLSKSLKRDSSKEPSASPSTYRSIKRHQSIKL